MTLLPPHSPGSIQIKILETLQVTAQRSIEDSQSEELAYIRSRQESALFTQGHFQGMSDLWVALTTFIFILEYMWVHRQCVDQPTLLFISHLQDFLNIFCGRPFEKWCDTHRHDMPPHRPPCLLGSAT